MAELTDAFCLDTDESVDLTSEDRKRNRMVGYVAAFLTVFTLGTTEIFASWYSTQMGGSPLEAGLAFGIFGLVPGLPHQFAIVRLRVKHEAGRDVVVPPGIIDLVVILGPEQFSYGHRLLPIGSDFSITRTTLN